MSDGVELQGDSTMKSRHKPDDGIRGILHDIAHAARGDQKKVYTDELTGERAGSAASRGICRYLKVSVWRSEAMYQMPADTHARLLYLYLLTGPHTLSCHVPGLYQVGRESLREELRLKPRAFNSALQSLVSTLGVETDFSRCIAWVPSALEHLGPPANPNIVKSYCRAFTEMPVSPLVSTALRAYAFYLSDLGAIFLKPFQDRFPNVARTMSEQRANGLRQVMKASCKEREKEIEKERGGKEDRDRDRSEGALPEETGAFTDDAAVDRIRHIARSLGDHHLKPQ